MATPAVASYDRKHNHCQHPASTTRPRRSTVRRRATRMTRVKRRTPTIEVSSGASAHVRGAERRCRGGPPAATTTVRQIRGRCLTRRGAVGTGHRGPAISQTPCQPGPAQRNRTFRNAQKSLFKMDGWWASNLPARGLVSVTNQPSPSILGLSFFLPSHDSPRSSPTKIYNYQQRASERAPVNR